jgi:hypothetical protein
MTGSGPVTEVRGAQPILPMPRLPVVVAPRRACGSSGGTLYRAHRDGEAAAVTLAVPR